MTLVVGLEGESKRIAERVEGATGRRIAITGDAVRIIPGVAGKLGRRPLSKLFCC